jgi:hypothetical protein
MTDDAGNADTIAVVAVDELLPNLDERSRDEALGLLRALAQDWLRQAEGLDTQTVVDIGRRELANNLGNGTTAERLESLRTIVLGQRVDRLSARAFALAKEAANVRSSVGAEEAGELDHRLDEVAALAQSVGDEDARRRLVRSIHDAQLDLEFVRGGDGPVSTRLGRYLQPG